MRIDIRNLKREPLFTVHVDDKDPSTVVKPPDAAAGSVTEIYLQWDKAIDDQGHLRHCPVCGCRELFVRKDFPQVTGFVIVVFAAVISMVLMGFRQMVAGYAVLVTMAVVDFLIYLFTPKCVVCYRCRSEFRDVPISSDQRGWELAIGEKYRDIADAPPTPPITPEDRR